MHLSHSSSDFSFLLLSLLSVCLCPCLCPSVCLCLHPCIPLCIPPPTDTSIHIRLCVHSHVYPCVHLWLHPPLAPSVPAPSSTSNPVTTHVSMHHDSIFPVSILVSIPPRLHSSTPPPITTSIPVSIHPLFYPYPPVSPSLLCASCCSPACAHILLSPRVPMCLHRSSVCPRGVPQGTGSRWCRRRSG